MRTTDRSFGVLWASTKNLGDDIQTLAAINMLKRNGIQDYALIDREKLSSYDGPKLNVIMNGWFMHDLAQFPPSDKINPLFISFHCAKPQLIDVHREYFLKHQPIGCRDLFTKSLLDRQGIDAYFSGCLSLGFEGVAEKTDEVFMVDVNSECKYIPNVTLFDLDKYNDASRIGHQIENFQELTNSLTKPEPRLKVANELLGLYKRAKLVITCRLHSALPCRAFHTPLKFIHKNYLTDKRFSGLSNVLNGSVDHCDIDNIPSNLDRKIIDDYRQRIHKQFADLITTKSSPE